jgi:hypothetical protein
VTRLAHFPPDSAYNLKTKTNKQANKNIEILASFRHTSMQLKTASSLRIDYVRVKCQHTWLDVQTHRLSLRMLFLFNASQHKTERQNFLAHLSEGKKNASRKW